MHSRRHAHPDPHRDTSQTPSTLVELLRTRATHQPDFLGYTFLADGETKEVNLTYGQLHRQASAIAAALESAGMAGERALMLFPPGLEFLTAFFGCLYSRVVAVPAYPPDRTRLNRTLPRLRAIIADAQAKVVLTTTPILALAEPLFAQAPDLAKLKWLATDGVTPPEEEAVEPAGISPDMLAFLQYTSGSTGAPKGVMLSHANLLHNASILHYAFSHTTDDRYASWLPTFHDMGFMVGVLQPLYAGIPVVFMSPVAFLQNPLRWLRAISSYKATTSGAPNFAYDLCARKVTPEQRATLDLSSWSVAFNGSEPIRAETLERFAATFEPCGFRRESFYPCYGLAEATLIVSGGHKPELPVVKTFSARAIEANRVIESDENDRDAIRMVSSGQSLPEEKIRVVDPESLIECKEGEVGEVWVSSPSVAQGYWGRPQETEQTFAARILDTGEGPFLRTGDLGFLQNGELFIGGRLKDLIIIRGHNHYPQDIEHTVERCHAALKPGCGAAFSVDAEGEERLVVVQELDDKEPPPLDSIIETIRRAIADEHEIQAYGIVLVKPKTIHKTSSGKIQRHACRNGFVAGSLDVVGEWRAAVPASGEQSDPHTTVALQSIEAIESALVSQLASKLRVQASEIDIDLPLSRYALDSLAAIELTHYIEKQLGVVLPMVSLLEELSIAGLAAQAFAGLAPPGATPDAGVDLFDETVGGYRLSYGQRALWFLYELAPETSAYNIANAARIRAGLNASALRSAFQTLVNRHPSLRTVFSAPDGEPFQRVIASCEVSFREEDASLWGQASLDERLVEESRLPFNLEQGPLMRVSLFRRSEQEHILLFVIHHIVADFWSIAVLLHELGAAYEAEDDREQATLAALAVDYTDYIRWQARLLAGPTGERLWAYWQKQLEGELPDLDLMTDMPRPPVQTYKGASQSFRLDAGTTDRLKGLSQSRQATLFMTLLSSFKVLLYRYTGQADLLVGSPSAGRSRAEFSQVVGYFVNPLVMRSALNGALAFETFLTQARQTVLEAFAHQDYPFALLVERLQPVRDPSRSPLFQVMFVFQKSHLPDEQKLASFALGEEGERVELGRLSLESIRLHQRVAQFDLTLSVAEVEGGLSASLEYNTDLFDHATVERMAAHFKTLLGSVATDSSRRISDLAILTEQERRQLLIQWNDTASYDAEAALLHELFEAQVERTPNRTAVTFEGVDLSYRDLNARANQLARHLRAVGAGPESLVGICMERSLEMVVALLGVLKAGAAYVPLDPTYPKERLAFMINDARIRVLLAQRHTGERLPEHDAQVIHLDTEWEAIAKQGTANPGVRLSADNLAYTIYTSGSTGMPKGAMNSHRGIRNRMRWMQSAYPLAGSDSVLQKTPFSFDVSIYEFFWPLLAGARLVVAKPEGHKDSAYLAGLIAEEKITAIHFVPSMLQVFLDEPDLRLCDSVRQVLCSGEALPHELQERFFARMNAELHNLYGPTEAAIEVTFWKCKRDADLRTVPIGRPIINTQIYLLDSFLQPVPAGVPGQLHIAGVNLARGYVNRPDLTADRFIPNPFGEEPGARLYRTGDLARYLSDGDIEYIGRLDHQVKIRGFRIELGEIEAALESHPSIREAVVLAREDQPGLARLAAYVVAHQDQSPATGELRNYLKSKLPDYMVPQAFVTLGAFPKLPSGKLNRKALPAPERPHLDSAEARAAARTPLERQLAETWAQVLKVEGIGIHDNFFELGGHSLLATQVVSRLRKALQIELPLRSLFEHPTVAALAGHVETIPGTRQEVCSPAIAPVTRQVDPPLSFAQQRLWFLEQFEPGGYAYNMPGAIRLSGRLDRAALERSLNEVVRRHEALRTTFKLKDGEPVQIIHAPLALTLPVEDLSRAAGRKPEAREPEALAFDRATQEAVRPFDLERGPLLRASLLRLAEEDHMLLVTLHHIICDGWSLGVFLRELTELYGAFAESKPSPLPELEIQYADFAHWQRQWLQGEVLQQQLSYWSRQLEGELPALHLRTDHPRPAVQTYRGAKQSVAISKGVTEALKTLSRREEVTLFMTLLAAFKTLLHRFTSQEDILVGSTIANRNRAETEGLIGFFVNTLVMRTHLSGNPTFRELLARVREVTLNAYAHQDLPFEKLVAELQPERDLSRSPLFQVMLNLQNGAMPVLRSAGLTFSPTQIDSGASIFDLTLELIETDQGLIGSMEYSADIFEQATIESMIGYFETLLAGIATSPALTISELPLLTGQERQQLLVDWNRTGLDLPTGKTINELFEAQAAKTPGATALIFEGRRLTYGQLDARANQLGHYLRRLGVGPEALVGIYLDRSFEMLVALLGVMKAGGAYVPLDTDYPQERLAYIMEDAGAAVILTESHLAETLPERDAPVICLDRDWPEIARESESLPESEATPDNLAYLIYTSGSTGKPKGVMITHRGVCNRLLWGQTVYPFSESDRILQLTSVCFDVSVLEFFEPLIAGAQLVIPGRGDHKDAARIVRLIAGQNVSAINSVPSMAQVLIEEPGIERCNSLRYLLLGGEAMPVDLKERVLARLNVALFNVYGPTEVSIDAALFACARGGAQSSVPIGRPVGNAQIYLLDNRLQPVPVGVPGMLYVGGAGVARGYFRSPDLTADRFIPNPFAGEPGARLYRSGDLACYLPDGNIDFIGRVDDQVKVRGFRVELGEIQSALSAHPAVKEAAVLAMGPGEAVGPMGQGGAAARNDKRIVAFAVPEDGQSPDASGLRDFLRASLPDYMVPAFTLIVDAMPLLPNGKIDRRALVASLDVNKLEPREAVIKPGTRTEETLAEMWAAILGVEQVGIHSNFFELGGHSLLATQVISRIRDAFQVEVPVRALFKSPTVAGLAAIIEQKQLDETGSEKLAEMLADLDRLSEEEVEALLASEEGIADEEL